MKRHLGRIQAAYHVLRGHSVVANCQVITMELAPGCDPFWCNVEHSRMGITRTNLVTGETEYLV